MQGKVTSAPQGYVCTIITLKIVYGADVTFSCMIITSRCNTHFHRGNTYLPDGTDLKKIEGFVLLKINPYLVSPAKNGRAPLARPGGWTS